MRVRELVSVGLGQLVMLVKGNNKVGFWNVESSSLRHVGCRRVLAQRHCLHCDDRRQFIPSQTVPATSKLVEGRIKWTVSTDMTLCWIQQNLLVKATMVW